MTINKNKTKTDDNKSQTLTTADWKKTVFQFRHVCYENGIINICRFWQLALISNISYENN